MLEGEGETAVEVGPRAAASCVDHVDEGQCLARSGVGDPAMQHALRQGGRHDGEEQEQEKEDAFHGECWCKVGFFSTPR